MFSFSNISITYSVLSMTTFVFSLDYDRVFKNAKTFKASKNIREDGKV